MQTDNPHEIKRLSYKIQGFDKDKWRRKVQPVLQRHRSKIQTESSTSLYAENNPSQDPSRGNIQQSLGYQSPTPRCKCTEC